MKRIENCRFTFEKDEYIVLKSLRAVRNSTVLLYTNVFHKYIFVVYWVCISVLIPHTSYTSGWRRAKNFSTCLCMLLVYACNKVSEHILETSLYIKASKRATLHNHCHFCISAHSCRTAGADDVSKRCSEPRQGRHLPQVRPRRPLRNTPHFHWPVAYGSTYWAVEVGAMI